MTTTLSKPGDSGNPILRSRKAGRRVIAARTLVCALLALGFAPSPSRAQSSAPTPQPVYVADFNHDGIPDVLTLSTTNPTGTIAFGTVPYGTFSSNVKALTFPGGCTQLYGFVGGSSPVTIGDFNGDGFPDIVFRCRTATDPGTDSIIGVLIGNGDGTFAPPALLPARFATETILGDFNNDGKLDIILVGAPPSGFNYGLLFFAGKGDGTFAAAVGTNFGTSTTFSPNFVIESAAAADVNGDGYLDLVTESIFTIGTAAPGDPRNLAVFGNNRDGTFGQVTTGTTIPNTTVTLGTTPSVNAFTVLPAHVFSTGNPDFLIPDIGDNPGVLAVRNTSTLTTYVLSSPVRTPYPGLQDLRPGTFTGSPFSDLAVSNGSAVAILANDGSGNFTASYASLATNLAVSFILAPFAVADANGDGYADLYTASATSTGVALAVNLVSGTATATSQPFTLPPGTTPLSASWPGNLNYIGSSATSTQTVAKTTPVVTLASTQNPAPLNAPITFTALVASATAITQIPTGSIIFTDGPTTLGTVPLDATGTATLTNSTLPATTHTIQAAYSGDSFFAPATGSFTQGVTAPGQLTANLLQNPGAELGSIQYWTPAGQGTPTVDTGTFDLGINPHTGAYDFLGHDGPSDSLSQTVSLLTQGVNAGLLDTGTLRAALSFYEQGLNQNTISDDAFVTLTFLDASGNNLSTVNSGEIDSHSGVWQNFSNTYPIPIGSRSITYTMNFMRHEGSDLDAFVDDNSLLILAAAPVAAVPSLTWTTPASIVFGTPLGSTQLNAVATSPTGALIPGIFTYTPAAGTTPPVGLNTLSVLFTPTDLTAFTTATATVPLNVLPATPTATLAITSGTTSVTTVAQGSVVTLTATVLTGSASIARGQVVFCDASAPLCTDIHRLGTAQLIANGTATISFIPAAGPHTYKAVFLGTPSATTIATGTSALNVTALYPTATTLTQGGSTGNYSLTATVTANGGPISPTGTVSFANTTNTGIVGSAPLGAPASALTFVSSGNTTGRVPIGVTPYDLNGDGKKDLVVNNTGDNTLSILLGKGDGTFTASATLATGGYPASVAIGDFNGDGFPDIAVVNFFDATLSIFLGRGDGTFTTAATTASGTNSRTVTTADFNRDGSLDLAVGHDNSVTILLGNGDGTFTSASTFATGNGPNYSIGTGDFNGDGIPDIAVSDAFENNLTILLGNGDGTFTVKPKLATGSTPVSLAIGDLNGDGKLDIAVADQGDNNVTILLGNGDGTFTVGTQPLVGKNPQGITIGDIDGDGIPDLAIANQDDSTLSILLGKGDGTFSLAASPATGVNPDRAAFADFDGDGIPDLASSNVSGGGISILLTRVTHTATASATRISPVGTGPQQIVANYPGNTYLNSSVSAETSLTGIPLSTNLTWTPTSPLISYGTALGPQQLNAAATSATNGSIAGTYTYTPAAGAILNAGRQTIQLVFTPTSPLYSSATATQVITIAQATPTLTWSTPASVLPGTALSATQLDATATGVTGTTLPGVFTYTPVAGTVFTTGPQTLSVLFTPSDTTDYTTARATVQLQVGVLTLTSFTPNTARIGDADKTITLTGLAFNTGSLVLLNGTRIATTFVNATTLTAVVPAANFTVPATLSIAVSNPASAGVSAALPLSVTAPSAAVTLTGPTTTAPGTQPALTFAVTNPYPVPLTASFNLSFASSVTPTVDDPAIQFANGGRNYTFTIAANTATVPAVQIQAGTVAGTITIPLTLTAAGVNVTPATVQPVVITIPAAVPNVSTATLTRVGNQLTVTVHGFSNTREVAQAAFHFVAATGATIDTPDVTIPVATIFSTWFTSTPSLVYGSTFTYTQVFSVSDTAANIGSVQVTLTNAVGASTTYTAQ